MVAEGEDWKSVEIPESGGSVAAPASSASEETEEVDEKPSGGNSNNIINNAILEQIKIFQNYNGYFSSWVRDKYAIAVTNYV